MSKCLVVKALKLVLSTKVIESLLYSWRMWVLLYKKLRDGDPCLQIKILSKTIVKSYCSLHPINFSYLIFGGVLSNLSKMWTVNLKRLRLPNYFDEKFLLLLMHKNLKGNHVKRRKAVVFSIVKSSSSISHKVIFINAAPQWLLLQIKALNCFFW